ncbi:unnamed protein product, partial [Scytosiphon promiscuus]
MKAFIDRPTMKGSKPTGRLLTVAFQGKQAAAVGGTTVHSVCSAGGGQDGNMSGDHDDQSALTANKAMHWKGVT